MTSQADNEETTQADHIWPSDEELRSYSAHGPVLEQANAFLTSITTVVGTYATVTGAAWVVVSANTFGVSNTTLLWILGLHIALSVGVAISLWGTGNNFIQRLNFARWLAQRFWPRIGRLGGPTFAWLGIPSTRSERLIVESFDNWKERQKSRGKLAWRLDFYLRYRAFEWPSIRFQRLWFCVPFVAAGFSVSLFIQVHGDGPRRKALCQQVSDTLSFSDSAPIARETLERARYLFDKAGCEITRIDPLRLRGVQKS